MKHYANVCLISFSFCPNNAKPLPESRKGQRWSPESKYKWGKLKFWRACSNKRSNLSSAPCGLQCMSVHIINREPVHVIPGSDLVLKARVEQGPLESISVLTWERELETGPDPKRVTLATCVGRSIKCVGTRPNVYVNVAEKEATLEIKAYSVEDSGVYILTVNDHKGVNTSAQCIVRIYGRVWLAACGGFSLNYR